MRDTLDHFVSQLQLPRTGAGPDGGSPWAVILTGSTGSLGTRILSELQALPKLRRIYCLNRSEEAEKAQITTLRKCGLPLPDERVTFIHASFESPRLGLSEQTWQQLASETTLIIHNAWPVNFVTALEGFKPHLEALRYLLTLSYEARHCPPFLYVSSLGIAYSAGLSHIPEEIFRDFSGVNGGYPQSKFIAERMVEAYARSTGCPAAVLRVGQIAGPVRSGGIWPHREWFPTLLRASSHIKALPSTLGPHDAVDWIPVDILSRIIVEIAEHVKVRSFRPNADYPLVFNIANPKTVSFGELLPYLNKVAYKTVPCQEWVRLFQESVAENPQIPGAKLLGFYDAAFTTRKALIETVTCNMMTASKTARGLQAVSGSWMVRWLDGWYSLAPREHL